MRGGTIIRHVTRYGSKDRKHENRKLIDYKTAKPSSQVIVLWTSCCALGLFLLGWLFYKHIVWSGVLCLLAFAVPNIVRKSHAESLRQELLYQFQQALQVLSAALAAGRSLENALVDSIQDLEQMFANPDALIVQEWRILVERIRNGVSLDEAMSDLALRSGIDDIQNFADVLTIGKRQGGNLVEVIRNAIQIMNDKLDIQRDIRILIARKKWESRLLCAAPVGFVAILGLTSSDYMAPLYDGIGRIVMTVALVIIGFSWWMSQRMMKIEV